MRQLIETPAEVNPLTDLGMMTMMTMKAPLVGQGLRRWIMRGWWEFLFSFLPSQKWWISHQLEVAYEKVLVNRVLPMKVGGVLWRVEQSLFLKEGLVLVGPVEPLLWSFLQWCLSSLHVTWEKTTLLASFNLPFRFSMSKSQSKRWDVIDWLKLTNCLWRMVGRWDFLLGWTILQGKTVSFREDMDTEASSSDPWPQGCTQIGPSRWVQFAVSWLLVDLHMSFLVNLAKGKIACWSENAENHYKLRYRECDVAAACLAGMTDLDSHMGQRQRQKLWMASSASSLALGTCCTAYTTIHPQFHPSVRQVCRKSMSVSQVS